MRVVKRVSFWDRISLTNRIIIFTCGFYILSLFLLAGLGEKFFLTNLAITPSLIFSGKSLWTFLTSIFVHGSFFHLFANMFSLFFMGNFLEKIIGSKRFFWIFIIAGLLGGIFYVSGAWMFNSMNIPAVGASGALFGVLGVLAVLVPHSRIYLIIGPLILIVFEVLAGPILPASVLPLFNFIFNILFLLMIFSLFSFNTRLRKLAVPVELPMWLLPIIAIVPLMIVARFIPLPIGNSAHLGGLVIGLIYGLYLRKRFPNKTRMISKRFS